MAAVEIVLRLAPVGARAALAALFMLDARFADILSTTSEPMIGRIRLAWWRDALAALDTKPAPAEPLLQRVQAKLLLRGIAGTDLAALTEGWDELLSGGVPDLTHFAERSGATLFTTAARLLNGDQSDQIASAGRGWALTRISDTKLDQSLGASAKVMARAEFHAAFDRHWPAATRSLGVLALLTRSDLDTASSPIRDLTRLIRFRLIGR